MSTCKNCGAALPDDYRAETSYTCGECGFEYNHRSLLLAYEQAINYNKKIDRILQANGLDICEGPPGNYCHGIHTKAGRVCDVCLESYRKYLLTQVAQCDNI